jgi:hypothetical protein
MHFERCSLPALLCLLFSSAHADDANSRSATMSVHGDENDNRQWLGKLAFQIGDHAWLQGSVGKTDLATAGQSDVRTLGAAVGVGGRTVNVGVEFVQRDNDARFKQQDWSAAVNWRGARGGAGVDAFMRSARGESQTTRPGGPFQPPVTTTIREAVDAEGFGLHGDFSLTPQATVFAGAMRYSYEFGANSAVPANTPLWPLLGSSTVLSGVWRDQAFIDRSYRVGGSYRFEAAALSAQYLRDRMTRTAETLDTMQVQAEVPIGERWLLTPTLGYSSGESLGGAAFAGLSLAVNW